MLAHERFEEEVLPHLDAGYNLARWLARNAHDADDVVQEACMRALRYINSLRAGQGRPWFLAIVRHAYYDSLKVNRSSELAGDPDGFEEVMVHGVAEDPQLAAERRDEASALARAMEALPLPLREVLVLRESEELSYKEIARVLGVPIGTVMSRLARARLALQKLLPPMNIGRDGGDSAQGRI